MAETGLKARILDTLAQSRDRERMFEQLCDDSPSTDPTGWTVKDQLAHLAHWRTHAACVLDAARTGSAPPSVDSEDAVNARIYAANRERPAAEVLTAARASYAELQSAVEACSEDELLRPRTGSPGATWEVIPANGHGHLGQHLTYWYQERGDERAAEEAQIWVRETQEAAFPYPKPRAAAAYNLGCYYALLGRAAEALPLFRRGFELDPESREWARADHDLDPIRDHPDIRKLLG